MASDDESGAGASAHAGGQAQGPGAADAWLGRASATAALREVLEGSLAAAARSVLPADVSVHLVDVSVCSYQRFHRGVQEPTCCYVILVRPIGQMRGGDQPPQRTVHLEFATEIAAPIVDMLLGGPGRARSSKPGPLTPIERRVLRRLADAVARCLARGLARGAPGAPEVAAEVQGPHAPQVATEEEGMMLLTFRLTCRGASGAMRLCMPAALLVAMAPAWPHGSCSGPTIELTATLPETHLPAEQAAALGPGDIVVTETPADGEVTIRLAGVAKFAGRLGSWNGRRAVTITRRLDGQQPP